MDESGGTRIAVDCLGCKLNEAETEQLARQLALAGYLVVAPGDSPDVYILNTCTVTHIADRKSRHLLRMARRRNPGARLVAIGCYAERASTELSGLEGVDLVLGNGEKAELVRRLEETGWLSLPSAASASGNHKARRTRAFVRVQDGCSRFCAYCIVPLVRGGEKSVPVNEVIDEVRQLVAGGFVEVVLTGTKVGAYHHSGLGLAGLLESILAGTDVSRIRLSSLQPQEITPELISLWRDNRLCPHFHLSLQSGSDAVLRRMKRRYTTAEYHQAVSGIRQALPGAAITTDVIVGFPCETEVEFQQSYDFCAQVGFSRIHVFPYSKREGTEAARMSPQVGDRAKQERSRMMLALAEASGERFRRQFLGTTMPVLWEKQSGGVWSGLTGNYIRVYTRSESDLTNRLLPVKLVDLRGDGVWGEGAPEPVDV